MDRWFGKEDIPVSDRRKWLGEQQEAGNGTLIDCGMCEGVGLDPDDGADCPRCRGTGTVLSERTP
ncbi:MAG TPA: hypothetical protein VG164_01350 [Trebonia sp.]|jgi:DnaJ-class molecular chaperone|nr:hypothetical protein [Trebonia sp.]